MKRFVIILGILLLVGGVVGLVHPVFTYHRQEEVAKLGPFNATVDRERTAQIPAALSIALLLSGIGDRKSTRLNSSHGYISYAVFCLKKKTTDTHLELKNTVPKQMVYTDHKYTHRLVVKRKFALSNP